MHVFLAWGDERTTYTWSMSRRLYYIWSSLANPRDGSPKLDWWCSEVKIRGAGKTRQLADMSCLAYTKLYLGCSLLYLRCLKLTSKYRHADALVAAGNNAKYLHYIYPSSPYALPTRRRAHVIGFASLIVIDAFFLKIIHLEIKLMHFTRTLRCLRSHLDVCRGRKCKPMCKSL
jgi:hypothetical protein